MARFSDIQKGNRARRTVAFPMPNTRCSLLPPLPELEAQRSADRAAQTTTDDATEPGSVTPEASDAPALVDIVVLSGVEEAKALEMARAAAVRAGVADPKPNEPLYDLAFMVQTLLIGCVDHDSPSNAPVPFFESAEQILKNLNRDQITHLFVQHEHWQDECSPRAKDLTEDQFYTWLVGVAESESPSDFFELLRPATLWRFTRTMVKLLAISRADKLGPGAISESSTPTNTSQAKPEADAF